MNEKNTVPEFVGDQLRFQVEKMNPTFAIRNASTASHCIVDLKTGDRFAVTAINMFYILNNQTENIKKLK